MMRSDRERLAISSAIAIGIHILILGLLFLIGWNIEPYPEYEPPIYVSLDDFELEEEAPAEPEPEPAPQELSQAEPTPEPEPEPEPAPPAAEPEPAPEPEPTPEPRREPEPTPEPEAEPEPEPAEPPPRDPLPPPDDVDLLGGDRTAERSRSERQVPDLDELASEREQRAELPDWVREEQDAAAPAERMDEREADTLAQHIERDPEFERQLREVLESVSEARRQPSDPREGDPAPGDRDPDEPTADRAVDDTGMIRGISGRGVPNIGLEFSAEDFGDNVPPITTIVVVFDVDARGFVVPGSLIFQQRSRYTRVNEKVREEVRGWRFEPLPSGQTHTQTGIFTLVINRGDVI